MVFGPLLMPLMVVSSCGTLTLKAPCSCRQPKSSCSHLILCCRMAFHPRDSAVPCGTDAAISNLPALKRRAIIACPSGTRNKLTPSLFQSRRFW